MDTLRRAAVAAHSPQPVFQGDLDKLFPLAVPHTTEIVRAMLKARTGLFGRKPAFPGVHDRMARAIHNTRSTPGYDWTLKYASPETAYQYAFFGKNHLLVPILEKRGGIIFRLVDDHAGPLVYATSGAIQVDPVLMVVLGNPEYKKLL